jgi:hypothetical protein
MEVDIDFVLADKCNLLPVAVLVVYLT